MSATASSPDSEDNSPFDADSRGRRRSTRGEITAHIAQLAHGTPRQQAAVEELEEEFCVSLEKLNALVLGFEEEMQAGLADDSHAQSAFRTSDLKMIPSYVTGTF